MKILAIGDIHGRNCWKQIIQKELDNVDKIVFIGDYFDSFNVQIIDQINNFLDILQFKKDNTDKVITLTGNHELHYFKYMRNKYSGYKVATEIQVADLLEEEVRNNNLQIAYKVNDILFTHAGVTKTWCNQNNINYDHVQIDKEINQLFKYRKEYFDIHIPTNGFGDEIHQGPLWVRPKSLTEDATPHLHIIGHTHNEMVEITETYINIDSLPKQYIIIDSETKKIEIKNV